MNIKKMNIKENNIVINNDNSYIDKYKDMMELEKICIKNLKFKLHKNFNNKDIVSKLRKEIELSNSMIQILSKLIKSYDNDFFDIKKYIKDTNKLEKIMNKKLLMKEKESINGDI